MEKNARIAFLIGIFLFLPAFFAACEGPSEPESDWRLYARALEFLLDGNTKDAVPILKDLVARFPDSPLRPKVEALLSKYANQLDRSGIVLFYLTNMLTTVAMAEAIPNFLYVQEGWIFGVTGLVGIGTGIAASYFLADKIDMSFGQELWIDLAQAVLTPDFVFLFDVFWPTPVYDTASYPPESVLLRNRSLALGSAITALAARAGAFAFVAGSGPLQPGKPAFILSNYAVSTAYTALVVLGILQRNTTADALVNDIVLTVVPTAIAAGSWFLWDAMPWRIDRTGFVALGVLGGGLAGICIPSILSGFMTVDQVVSSSLILGGAVAGQALAVFLTQDIPTESSPATSQNPMRLSAIPTVDRKGRMGALVSLSY